MKLQVGNYYLNARGEIRKIVRKSYIKTSLFPYWDSDRSYASDGKYTEQFNAELDLLLEIPKDKYKSFLEELINDQRDIIDKEIW